jgi:large subunit ribosomal protein L18
MDSKIKKEKKMRRKLRVRAKISGTNERPRLSVSRSNKHIVVQLIDDTQDKTLIFASDLILKKKGKKTDLARETGRLIAKMAVEKKIKKVVFDRGGHKYHGRVKAVAEGAREGGLEF